MTRTAGGIAGSILYRPEQLGARRRCRRPRGCPPAGVILFEAAHGRSRWGRRRAFGSAVQRFTSQRARRLAEVGLSRPLGEPAPSALSDAVDRALQRDQERRFHSAADMAAALRACLTRDGDTWAWNQARPGRGGVMRRVVGASAAAVLLSGAAVAAWLAEDPPSGDISDQLRHPAQIDQSRTEQEPQERIRSHIDLGLALIDRGDVATAAAEADRARVLLTDSVPDSDPSRYMLEGLDGRILAARGNLAPARNLLRRASAGAAAAGDDHFAASFAGRGQIDAGRPPRRPPPVLSGQADRSRHRKTQIPWTTHRTARRHASSQTPADTSRPWPSPQMRSSTSSPMASTGTMPLSWRDRRSASPSRLGDHAAALEHAVRNSTNSLQWRPCRMMQQWPPSGRNPRAARRPDQRQGAIWNSPALVIRRCTRRFTRAAAHRRVGASCHGPSRRAASPAQPRASRSARSGRRRLNN